ncbi:putative pectinesterase 63 [Humulus lupulus]|uniref:putative pectinesterase 63 n=1 Tax=Humulus lupulus TaxID=3486 RepID=UPI002B40B3DC|nr:putative pectinesterase 63 [Humulus lupulus]
MGTNFEAAFLTVLSCLATTTVVLGGDTSPIPESPSGVSSWFSNNVKQLSQRKSTLDAALFQAECGPVEVITVQKDGKGNFNNIKDAINSVPNGNTKRVVISIGPGEYKEKITIDRSKTFITLYGNPKTMPTLVYGGTAAQYGTVDSATLIALADYFTAANIIFKNSAPEPDGRRSGAQAVALRVSGNKSSFYNCRFIGFQDTLCDDKGFHFFKDCYIEGTVDFIFGSGTSLYLNTKLHVIGTGVVTAQARESERESTGYSFVHCKVTGSGKHAFLGRAWMSRPRVVFAFSSLSDVVNPLGWSDNFHPECDNTVFFGEYKNTGPGASNSRRAKFTKLLTYDQVKPYISLGFIKGSTWLLPPPTA